MPSASTGMHSYGVTLENATAASYATVGEVLSISGPNIGVGSTKTTHLDITDAAHTYVAGLIEGGEVTFGCNFNKTAFNTQYGYIRTTLNWRMVIPGTTGGTFTWSGHITEYPLEVPEDDRIVTQLKMKVSGKPTFTPTP